MSARGKFFIYYVMAIVIIILVAWIVFRKVSNASNCANTTGTIKALTAALYSEMQDNSLGIKVLTDKSEQKWQFLSKETYDDLITNIGQKYNLDAPRGWKSSMPLTDIWGQRFAMLYRRLSERLDFIVISAGPDGTYGTADDIESDAELLKTVQMSYDNMNAVK